MTSMKDKKKQQDFLFQGVLRFCQHQRAPLHKSGRQERRRGPGNAQGLKQEKSQFVKNVHFPVESRIALMLNLNKKY